MTNLDEALNKFEVYASRYQQYIEEDLTETDTRSKLIDFLLIEVLGWHEDDIRREGHVDSGYFDYLVSIPGIFFIIEAKRHFKSLILPVNHKQSSLNALLRGNKDQIDQIRKYCFDESIPYGVITNGYQFILLKAYNSDNKPWKENICLLFDGVEDIRNRFIEFYDNLSKFGVVNTGGFKYDLPIASFESKTIISDLIEKDKELVRNRISSEISIVIDRIFGEIFSEEREDDAEFVNFCFVDNKETKKNKDEIERLFSDTAPKIKGVIPAINADSIAKQITSEIANDEISISSQFPPKPIIVIGSKGAGKTTFINHLFKYRLSSEELENHFVIYIDFRKLFESINVIEHGNIIDEALEKLHIQHEDLQLHSLKVLIRVYYRDIKKNDQSIWLWNKENDLPAYNKELALYLKECTGDPIRHFNYLSRYLIRERRKRLIIVIDNADQFKDSIQEDLFRFAHSLTKASLCGTVISLREGYYNKWQNSPPFDAYESNVYHITAPSYAEILQRRIDFALEKAVPGHNKIKGDDEKGYRIELPASDINQFLAGLRGSILSPENSEIIDFLNYTTYPNLREGLRIFKSFLTSGHTKVDEYIIREKFRNLESDDSRRVIPIHEFVRSVGLQNRHYYNSEISIVYNLFVPSLDSTDHFLKLYILNELKDLIERKNYTEKLVPNTTLIEKFSSLGYRVSSINFAISNMISKGLIDTDEHLSDVIWTDLPNRYNLCLTLKGFYYITELVNRFFYLDLVLQDTPILKPEQFDSIRSSFPQTNESGKRNLLQRLDTVKLFLDYLVGMEQNQPAQVRSVFGDIMSSVVAAFEREELIVKAAYQKSVYYKNKIS